MGKVNIKVNWSSFGIDCLKIKLYSDQYLQFYLCKHLYVIIIVDIQPNIQLLRCISMFGISFTF